MSAGTLSKASFKPLSACAALILSAGMSVPATAQLAQTLQFRATDLVEQGFVGVSDINAYGAVLGFDSIGRSLLFDGKRTSVLEGGKFLFLNDLGQAAGSHHDAATGRWESRIYSEGQSATLNLPGNVKITAFNNSGQMLAVNPASGESYFGTSGNFVRTTTDLNFARLNNAGWVGQGETRSQSFEPNSNGVVMFQIDATGSVKDLHQTPASYDHVAGDGSVWQYESSVIELNDAGKMLYSQTTRISCLDDSYECWRTFSQPRVMKSWLLGNLLEPGANAIGLGFVDAPEGEYYDDRLYQSLNNLGDMVSGGIYETRVIFSDGSAAAASMLLRNVGISLDDFHSGILLGDSRSMVVSGTNIAGDPALVLLSPVPEPGPQTLLTAGLLTLLAVRRRRVDRAPAMCVAPVVVAHQAR